MRSCVVLFALALSVGAVRLAAGQAPQGAAAGQLHGSGALAPGARASPNRLGRPYPVAPTTLQRRVRENPRVYVSVVHPKQANLGGRRGAGQLQSRRSPEAGLEAQTPRGAPGMPFGVPLR